MFMFEFLQCNHFEMKFVFSRFISFVHVLFASSQMAHCQFANIDGSVSVAWTGQVGISTEASIFKLTANLPPNRFGSAKPSDLFNEKNGAMGAIASDLDNKRIFFQEKQNNFLGVHSLATKETKKYFDGMMETVVEIAFDWESGNLYWTDRERRTIVVVDPTLSYYSTIYKGFNSFPEGITVHPAERTLYFSLFGDDPPSIVKSTMAGENPVKIYESQGFDGVASLSIDIATNRLYWASADYLESKIKSSNLDGSGIVEHLSARGAYFIGVAALQNTVYITDNARHYEDQGRAVYYKIWRKQEGENATHITTTSRPNKITYLNPNHNTTTSQQLQRQGACKNNGLPACQQICLPMRNEARKCACAVGYTKVGDTNCTSNLVDDNFLLVVDGAQKKIFQLSLSANREASYHVVPIPAKFDRKVVTMAINSKTKTFFWSDKMTSTIYKFMFNSKQPTLLKQGMHARALAIEPITGNIYFSDENTGYIYVMNENGKFLKTLLNSRSLLDKDSVINDLAVDPKNGFLYYLEKSLSGIFKYSTIKRIKLSNGSHEDVIKKISKCEAIHIDYDKQSLLYSVKGNVIYEVPLASLGTVNGRRPSTAVKHTVLGLSYYGTITDFTTNGNKFYITEMDNNAVTVFEPGKVEATRKFGVADFYKPTLLETYRSRDFSRHIAPIGNPCNNSLCTQLCIVTSSNESTCACQNGRRLVGYNCLETSGEDIDQPPTPGNSCPSNSEVFIQPCQKRIPLVVEAPQWTDDRTAANDLILTQPEVRDSYPPGTHRFLFTAKDASGHLGLCTYTITVTRRTCSYDVPKPFGDLVMKEPRCLNNEYFYPITCAYSQQSVLHEGKWSKEVKNVCVGGEYWDISRLDQLSCGVAPTLPQTTTNQPTTSHNDLPKGPDALEGDDDNGKDEEGGLPVSSSVVIALVCILLIAGLIVVAVFLVRRKGLFVAGTQRNFRMFWNPADERGALAKEFDAQSLQSIA